MLSGGGVVVVVILGVYLVCGVVRIVVGVVVVAEEVDVSGAVCCVSERDGFNVGGTGNDKSVFLLVNFFIEENRDLERKVILGFILYIGEIACKRAVLLFWIIMKLSVRDSSSGSGIKFLI